MYTEDGLFPPTVFDRGIRYVLALHGPPTHPEPQDATPLLPTLHWATLSNEHSTPYSSHRRLTVCGTLGGPALLHHDPNRLFFNVFGDAQGSTMMLRVPSPATLQPLPKPDPTGQGRRLFEVVLTPPKLKAGASRAERDRYRVFRAPYEEHSKKVRYILVVALTTAGPHRLLIWQNARVQEVLHDPQRGYRGNQHRYDPAYSIEFYEEFLIPPPCYTSPEGQH